MTDAFQELVAITEEPSPELDSKDAIDVTTLTADEGELLLHFYEHEVREGYRQTEEGKFRMRRSLFIILDTGLWHFAQNKRTEKPFGDEKEPKKEEYIQQLASDMQISRSQIFDKQATFRVATHGMGLNMEQIEDIGLSALEIAKSKARYDRDNGSVIDIPGATIPQDTEPGDFLRQAVIDTAHRVEIEHKQPKDFPKLLNEYLGIEEPELRFFKEQNGVGFNICIEYRVGKHWERGVRWEYIHPEPLPEYVADKVIRYLKMTKEA